MTKEKELATTGATNYPAEKEVKSMLVVENMAKLKKKYDPDLIPEANEKGDEGYLTIHSMVMDITKVRTGIEARRKDIKKDALDFGKLVDGQAKELTAAVEALEAPWKKLKIKLDEKEAKEAEEARQKEARRIELIEAKVNQLKSGADGLLGVPVNGLKERLAHIEEVVIDESYSDYMEVAEHHKATVIQEITKAIAERETFEEQQAQVKLDQEAAAEKQRLIDAKNAETQRKLDEQQAAIDKQKAAQKVKDDAELQRQVDEAETERKRIVEEAAADEPEKQRKEKEAELYKRLPEDVKIREYVKELMGVKAPLVESEEMQTLVNTLVNMTADIATHAYENTQDPGAPTSTVVDFNKEK